MFYYYCGAKMVITTSIVSFTFTSWLSVKSFSFSHVFVILVLSFTSAWSHGFFLYLNSVFSFRVGLFSCLNYPRFGPMGPLSACLKCFHMLHHSWAFPDFWHSRCSNDLLCFDCPSWQDCPDNQWAPQFLFVRMITKNKIWVLEVRVCSLLLRWHCS